MSLPQHRSRKANVGLILIGFLLVMVLLGTTLFFLGKYLFAATEFSGSEKFHQYVGIFDSKIGSDSWYFNRVNDRRPVMSETIRILDYEITTRMDDRGCDTKRCMAEPDGDTVKETYVDDYGCQHFNVTNAVYEFVCNDEYQYRAHKTRSCSECQGRNAPGGGCPRSIWNQCECGEQYIGDEDYETGGIEEVDCQFDCYYEATVTRNNKTVLQIDKTRSGKTKELEDLRLTFKRASRFKDWQCIRIENEFHLITPSDKFVVDITAPLRQVFQGEDVEVDVIVRNYWRDVNVEMVTMFEVPTTLNTPSREERRQTLLLKKGDNKFSYTIPTTRVTDELRATVTLNMFADASEFENLNIDCGSQYGIEPVQYCGQVDLGSATSDTYKVQIIPKPIYINITLDCTTAGCPEGYDCQQQTGLCIDTVIVNNTLTCQQIGCPTVVDPSGEKHHYQCQSSGICSELVFVYVYQDCHELGCPVENGQQGQCLLNGACRYVDEITKEVIREVKVKEDCEQLGCIKIDGVSGVCMDNGACQYTQTIREEVIKEIPIERTCAEDPSMCPTGTVCDKQSKTCIREKLFTEIVQCEQASDCYQPCQGIDVSCPNNRCDYKGNCEPVFITIEKERVVIQNQTVEVEKPVIRYERVELDCTTLGCGSEDYYCDSDRRVCIEKPKGFFARFFSNLLLFIKRVFGWVFGFEFI